MLPSVVQKISLTCSYTELQVLQLGLLRDKPIADGILAKELGLRLLLEATMDHHAYVDHRKGYSANETSLPESANQSNKPTCMHKLQRHQLAASPFH